MIHYPQRVMVDIPPSVLASGLPIAVPPHLRRLPVTMPPRQRRLPRHASFLPPGSNIHRGNNIQLPDLSQDPFGFAVFFYATYQGTTADIAGNRVVTSVGGPPILDNNGAGLLPFTDSTTVLNPNGGRLSYAWGSGPAIGGAGTLGYTWETWVFVTGITGASRTIYRADTPTAVAWGLDVLAASLILQIQLVNTSWSPATAITAGAWNAVAVVGFPAVTVRAYINGNLDANNGGITAAGGGVPTFLRVGQNEFGTNQFNAGRIGPIRATAVRRYTGASYTVPTALPPYP